MLILGEAKVGKTSFIQKCFSNKFNNTYQETIGVDFKHMEFQTQDRGTIVLSVWNTAGNWRFAKLGFPFHGNTDVVILMYDITKPNTFPMLDKWQKTYEQQDGVRESFNNPEEYGQTQYILIGNKMDVQIDKDLLIYT